MLFWIYTITKSFRLKTPKSWVLEEATAYEFKRGRQSRRITVQQCTVHTEMCYCGTSKACEHYQVQGQSSHCCHELTIHNTRWIWGLGARSIYRKDLLSRPFGQARHQNEMWTLQVNLCQKLFFLQNMGRTCCVQKLFWMSETTSVHNIFSPGLNLEFSRIELVIQWTISCYIVG